MTVCFLLFPSSRVDGNKRSVLEGNKQLAFLMKALSTEPNIFGDLPQPVKADDRPPES